MRRLLDGLAAWVMGGIDWWAFCVQDDALGTYVVAVTYPQMMRKEAA